jgi:putative transposase
MEQQARNATMEEWGFLRGCRYLLHDRDRKFSASFRELIESGSVKTIRLPARSPNLNSFAARWVRSVIYIRMFAVWPKQRVYRV